MMQGTPDTLDGVSAVAKKAGIDRNSVETIYQKYGRTPQAKMICSFFGTTPEALKKDAETIVGGSTPYQSTSNPSKRFPRLK